MSYYSHSQIHTYLTCPLKYKYDKIDGLGKTTKESSLNLILGTAVHAALEFVYKQRTNLRTPAKEQMIQRYDAVFVKECKESTTPFTDEDKTMYQERGHVYLNWYRETYCPFDQAITMAVEQSFSIKLDDRISFSGYIDRVDVAGEELILIDYKTSKQVEPDDADTYRAQLTLYALGMRQKYRSKFTTITCRLIYLHLQKEVTRTVTTADFATIKQRYLNHAQHIDTAKDHYEKDPNDISIFPAQVGKHCTYCPFRELCPEWKHEFMDDTMLITDLGESTIKTLIDEYAVLNKQISTLEKEKKTIAQILIDYATEHHLERIYGHEWQTSLQSRTYRSVREEHERLLRTYAKENGLVDELIKTDTNALAKLIQEQKIDLTAIQDRLASKTSTRLGPVAKKK